MSLKIDKVEYDKLFNKAKFILGDTYILSNDEYIKIGIFYNSFKKEKVEMSEMSTIETYFILQSSTDEERIKLTEKIYNWCWDNNIPIFNVVMALTGLYIGLSIALRKVITELQIEIGEDKDIFKYVPNYEEEDERDFVYSSTLDNFRNSLEIFMNTPNVLEHNPNVYKELVRNTYNEIKKRVKKNINSTTLPLRQYSLDWKVVLSDIENDESRLMEIIGNPKSFSKIKQENHFLHHLRYDDLDFDENQNIIFGGHTKALGIGYTQKAILLSLDKNIAIRELKTKLKHLKDYRVKDSQKLIVFTEQLIGFINQKKYANMIPFKSLSKEIGITKNQAKNYAKRLFSINDNTFNKNFEDIKLFNK